MEHYSCLSELLENVNRNHRQVLAILSLNGQSYFVFNSNPDKLIPIARKKVFISNQLLGIKPSFHENNQLIFKLADLMSSPEMTSMFPRGNHAEESLIKEFPEAIKLFKENHPNQKVKTIDIILTHSPCSQTGSKIPSRSSAGNNFFLPVGCKEKLDFYFKTKKMYKNVDKKLFEENTKVRISYHTKFDENLSLDDSFFIKEIDPSCKNLLTNSFNL